jgi:hypothetical protein
VIGLWVAVVVLAAGVVFLGLVLAAAVRRMDELRAEVAALSERLDPVGEGLDHPPSGIPVGSAAPTVAGDRIGGGRWSSSAWAGRRFIVAFADPGCVACDGLVPELIEGAGAGDLVPTVVVGAPAPDAWPPDWQPPASVQDRVVVVADGDGIVAAAFDSGFTPHVFVVDEGGAVTAQGPADSLGSVRTLLREAEGIRIVRPGAADA